MSHIQTVPPATAGRETAWVGLCAAVIVAMAALTVHLRVKPDPHETHAATGVDARSDLNPAEQGLHADLLVAAEEIRALHQQLGQWPTVQELVEQGLPPFPPGFDTRTRGNHRWHRVVSGERVAYVGVPAAPGGPRALLWLPATSSQVGDTIWIRTRETPNSRVEELPRPDAPSLHATGWQPIVHTYDAGVTRHAH